jgi:2,4-dienoyl-CoA reductase-like NADH-dependent reductase (Old Yellow Enzyme family)
MPTLFEPLHLRAVTLRSRIGMSPMCQYSAVGGVPQTWHITHLGARASGGAGLVMAEATAVEPRGRISLADTGLWNAEQAAAWAPIAAFIASQGAVPGMQLAHAGRKAGTAPPWEGGKPYAAESGWTEQPLGPTAEAFAPGWQTPREMDRADMAAVRDAFVESTRLAIAAGFKVLELHMAHGYLLHSFYSPISNTRGDSYGGSLPNRLRYPLEVAEAVRAALPAELPLFVRISATDWIAGGWDIEQSIVFARLLKKLGVDLLDCSSGAISPASRPPVVAQASGLAQGPPAATTALPAEPLYQVPFAEAIRREAAIPTAAVGLITTAEQAASVISGERADLVMIGRAMLRDPYWALHAAQELGVEAAWPRQYWRAK